MEAIQSYLLNLVNKNYSTTALTKVKDESRNFIYITKSIRKSKVTYLIWLINFKLKRIDYGILILNWLWFESTLFLWWKKMIMFLMGMISLSTQGTKGVLYRSNTMSWAIRTGCLFILSLVWMRASLPRIPFYQLMSFAWTVLLPLFFF